MKARTVAPLCIVTRPAAQAGPEVAALQAAGLRAAALPLIAIAPPPDPSPVHDAWAALPGCALAMFVSANAVQHFFALRPLAQRHWPQGVIAGCTGPGTAAALQTAGVPAHAIVQPPPGAPQESESLWAQLGRLGQPGQQGRPGREAWPPRSPSGLAASPDPGSAPEPPPSWRGRRVLVVRGEDGRDWLADTLREQGADLGFVVAYRRQPPRPDAAGQALLAAAQAEPCAHLWLFSSSQALLHLQGLAPGADWTLSAALASHPRIAAAARQAGFGTVAQQGLAPAEVARWLLTAEAGAWAGAWARQASIHSGDVD